jgi:hypothetical protein
VGVRVGGVRWLLRWWRRVAGAGEAALLVIRVHGGGGAGLGGGSASYAAVDFSSSAHWSVRRGACVVHLYTRFGLFDF